MAHKESPDDFAQRIFQMIGLRVEEIPDAKKDDPRLTGGYRVTRTPHGTLYLLEHIYQDLDGIDHYRRAVLVGRSTELPLALLGADGALPGER